WSAQHSAGGQASKPSMSRPWRTYRGRRAHPSPPDVSMRQRELRAKGIEQNASILSPRVGNARLKMRLLGSDSKPARSAAEDRPAAKGRRRAPLLTLQAMLDLLALGQVHRVLADVGGEVGDPLKVAAHEQQLQRR